MRGVDFASKGLLIKLKFIEIVRALLVRSMARSSACNWIPVGLAYCYVMLFNKVCTPSYVNVQSSIDKAKV